MSTDPLTNPFARRMSDGRVVQTCDATDRIEKVRRFDANQCQQALQLDHLQTTVVLAIHRRLRQLEREALMMRSQLIARIEGVPEDQIRRATPTELREVMGAELSDGVLEAILMRWPKADLYALPNGVYLYDDPQTFPGPVDVTDLRHDPQTGLYRVDQEERPCPR